MIYFEDLVIKAYHLVEDGHGKGMSPWSQNFIKNVGSRMINEESPRLSTNQAEAMKKVLSYFVRNFVAQGLNKQEVENCLKNPLFKAPLYISPAVKKECRHLGANYLGFRFKYNPTLSKEIQDAAGQGYFYFDKNTKLWVIQVTETNLEMVVACIAENRIELDAPTETWIESCKLISTLKDDEKISGVQFDKETNCFSINVIANEKLQEFVSVFLKGIFI